MKNIKIFCSWNLEFELFNEKQIELYVDKVPVDKVPDETIRFVFLLEPPEILDLSQVAIQGLNNETFNYLFTHNQELIDISNKSFIFPFATSWIENYKFTEKKFEVSTLVGGKRMAPGHLLRQKLWFKENKILIPKKFFLSGNYGGIENYNNNPILGHDKSPLFDSQFHICIENVKRKNWFTEKLIDCLQTKVVPIYYGCPNINDWFDTRGFIIVDDLNEIIDMCNNLTPETYSNMIEYVEANYLKSIYYKEISNRLKEKILENSMKFSIIIPAYEAKGRAVEFITDLLNSISKQTYKNFEIIISDHSQNNDIEILCSKYTNIDIKHFYNEIGLGNSSINMNEGIKLATGDIIKIMHMDDVICNSDCLKTIYETLQTIPEFKWGALTFNHNYEGQGIRRTIVPDINSTMGCPSVSFFINDENFFDENLIIINDYDMHQRLYKKYGDPIIIGNEDDIYITIRMHKDQVSNWIGKNKEEKEWEYYKNK